MKTVPRAAAPAASTPPAAPGEKLEAVLLGSTAASAPSWRGDLACLGAGLLLPLAFAPFDYWPLALACPLLLVLLLQSGSPGRAALRNYLFGVGMYGSGVSWIYVSIHDHGGASMPLAAGLVLLFVLAFSGIAALQGYVYGRWLRGGRWASLIGFALLWVLQEWTRTWLLTGFPWLLIGYAVMQTPLIHLAPVAGVLGVSLAALLTVALGAGLLLRLVRPGAGRRGLLVPVAAVCALWLGSAGLGRIGWVEATGEALTTALVQGNVPQEIKWVPGRAMEILDHYWRLSGPAWDADLLVWPEAAVTLFRHEAGNLLDRIDRHARREGAALVTGIPSLDPDSGSYRNSALVLGDGEGLYQKVRLVPFGEYVPLEDSLRGLIRFFDLPMSHSEPGPERQPPLVVKGHRVSLSICYEVVYPELVRTTAADADLLATISNDTWFGRSIGPHQHLQMVRMRAIEHGRYLVRATNNGITAIVDETGRVTQELPQFQTGVLRGELRFFRGRTPFSRWGSLPVVALCGLGALLLALGRALRTLPVR